MSDPDKPLLKLTPGRERQRQPGPPRAIPQPDPFPRSRQTAGFSPKFNRLSEVLARDPSGLELRADPSALAPERLLVFEVRGAVDRFANAIRNVPGLELIDEEELAADGGDKAPIAYLMVPDVRALRDLESLWRRWLANDLRPGETPWRNVFALLRELRPWGPQDRVDPTTADILTDEVEGRPDDELVRLEIELIFRARRADAEASTAAVRGAIQREGGVIVSAARIADIAYDALLVDLPASVVKRIIQHDTDSIAGLEPVMHIRPQSTASGVEFSETEVTEAVAEGVLGSPILALLDGVPVAAHPLLSAHLVVDDQFGLEEQAQVSERRHGTAMASLAIHGDLLAQEPPLGRRVHLVPVLGDGDAFPADRLIVDVIYTAVLAMRQGPDATAPDVVIVNLSLGNSRRPFHGRLSGWARLLDRLAYQFGLLFIVSAGNCTQPFPIEAYANSMQYEDALTDERATETLKAIWQLIGERRLFSPAETVNGLTVGALNIDNVPEAARAQARVNVDPYGTRRMSNASSAAGPGFALSVKPDVMMPGAKEQLRVIRSTPSVEVRPASPSRFAGLKVAAPPQAGMEAASSFTNGTSAAAALTSRVAHRIYDALEASYGEEFANLPSLQKAVLLKALLVHTAEWPRDTADWIRNVIGPANPRQHVLQKDNIRRFLGFGAIDADAAVACAADRATFWTVGTVNSEGVVPIHVPVPLCMGGQARPHSLCVTLAWFTPTAPGRKSYRSVRLQVLEPDEREQLRVAADRYQPDLNQIRKGTVMTRRWTGERAPAVGPNMEVELLVQRNPDQGGSVDDPIPYGLAVTLAMPGVERVYEEVRQRLAVPVAAQARV